MDQDVEQAEASAGFWLQYLETGPQLFCTYSAVTQVEATVEATVEAASMLEYSDDIMDASPHKAPYGDKVKHDIEDTFVGLGTEVFEVMFVKVRAKTAREACNQRKRRRCILGSGSVCEHKVRKGL